MTPETCNSPDTSSNMSGSNGDQAVNAARPVFWKHKRAHGHQYAVKQLHFPTKEVGMEWIKQYHPHQAPDALAGWADEAPTFDANIWADIVDLIAPALPQEVAALVERLDKSAEYLRAFPSRSSVEETAISLFGETKALILSQSSTIASAREVIEQVAEGSIDASATAIIIGWPTARTVLDAAREWKGRK